MSPRNELSSFLRDKDNFLVVSHTNPDGDAIGSMLAMGCLLQEMGKSFSLYNQSGLPERFTWLEPPWNITSNLSEVLTDHRQWFVVLDCGDNDRMGEDIEPYIEKGITCNIDHHMGNPHFGFINWVEPDRSSVGEMIALLAQDLGFPLSGVLGQSLYLAIVSDTGFFSYSNTTPETLQIVSKLLQAGLDPGSFNAKYQQQWTLNKLRLHGYAMQDVSLYSHGQIGVIRVSKSLLHETQTTSDDCEGLVNYPRQIKGVKVAVSLRQQDSEQIRFSLRSWGEINVRDIAVHFDGGGHHNASGGTIKASLTEAEKHLVQAIQTVLKP